MVEEYFAERRAAGYAGHVTGRALRPLLGYLRRLGVVPLVAPDQMSFGKSPSRRVECLAAQQSDGTQRLQARQTDGGDRDRCFINDLLALLFQEPRVPGVHALPWCRVLRTNRRIVVQTDSRPAGRFPSSPQRMHG